MPSLLTNNLDSEDRKAIREYRVNSWKTTCRKQFELAYYANIPPAITDEMAIYELDLYYSFLEDTKNAEREVAEQRMKALQGK